MSGHGASTVGVQIMTVDVVMGALLGGWLGSLLQVVVVDPLAVVLVGAGMAVTMTILVGNGNFYRESIAIAIMFLVIYLWLAYSWRTGESAAALYSELGIEFLILISWLGTRLGIYLRTIL